MCNFRGEMPNGKRETAQMVTALVHLYRGEVTRADVWRSRMDTTTNWALTTTAAVITFGLGSATASHGVLLIGMFMVLNFLLIETRRYRSWDLYLRRVRLLELSLFTPLLRDDRPDLISLRELATMLEAPRINLPFWTALSQRVKRAYGALFGVLLAAWVLKITIEMRGAQSFGELVDRMHVSIIPGWIVLLCVLVFYLALVTLVTWGLAARPPQTELLVAPKRRGRPLRAAFVRPVPERFTDLEEIPP